MRLILGLLFALLATTANAQISAIPTTNNTILVITGNTLQVVLAANRNRNSLTIQNNNVGDSCFLIFADVNVLSQITPGTTTLASTITINGVSVTVKQAAIVLTAGTPYQRYYPHMPSDVIFGTCATAGDSLYVDTQ